MCLPSCQSPGQNKYILTLYSSNQEYYTSFSNSSVKCLGTSLTHKQKAKGSLVSKQETDVLFNPPGLEDRAHKLLRGTKYNETVLHET